MTVSDNLSAIEKALEALKNAPGPWEVESEKMDDLSPKHDEFALHNADGYRMCGTENADWRFSEIVTDGPDEDGFFSDWNDPGERLMKYIAACNPVAISTLPAEARKAEALTGIGSAHDLVNDWLGEGTDDLPDDTPVRIEIGKRTIIADTLGSLRRARTLLNGGSVFYEVGSASTSKGQADE